MRFPIEDRRRWQTAALLLGLCLACGASTTQPLPADEPGPESDRPATAQPKTVQQTAPQAASRLDAIRPLLRKHCQDCHGSKSAEAGVDLERLTAQPDFATRFKTWEKVAAVLRQRRMPPKDSTQPTAAERQAAIRAIAAEFDSLVRTHAGDPGRVVLRRLTSAEYDYTIQDLTSLDLDVERTFLGDAVGGEGFTNVGDVQFIQDSTLERYLEAAKIVSTHAVIGAGPLSFFPDPGRTGRELSAIDRIQRIYRRYGFRTGAGEGAEPFGLDLYPKALFAAWRYRHRRVLGLSEATLARLAAAEGLTVRFSEHVRRVVDEPSQTFPTANVLAAWRSLPVPIDSDAAVAKRARAGCDEIAAFLRDWQGTLASASGDEEEVSVLTEGEVQVAPRHSFRADLRWPPDAAKGRANFSVTPAGEKSAAGALVIWRNPRIRFRTEDMRWTRREPLAKLLTPESVRRVAFGRHPRGGTIGPAAFVLPTGKTTTIDFRVPANAVAAQLYINVELDREFGKDGIVRCSIDDGKVEGETAAETGSTSMLLADPKGSAFPAWAEGVREFARKFPEVSHREPAPSDRDPIPAPFDNTYNTAERNLYHYRIKYHRDDRFLVRHILDDATRRRLDQAWTDLLTSFEYHDACLDFVAKKFSLDLPAGGVAKLAQADIDRLPPEPRRFAQTLYDGWHEAQRALQSAEPGHVDDAVRFARLAWRRPLEDADERRLREFYAALRTDAGLTHVQAIRALLARILVAPEFLYRVENPPSGPGVVPLSDWERAGRLSYFLWSSIPDAELRRAAAAGELQDPRQLEKQARRMLHDPKARRFATEFFGQWFGFYRFDEFNGVDAKRFPEFRDSLKAAMYDEAVSFFEYIVREDRPIGEILAADYTFLNRELAAHYGVATDVELAADSKRVTGVGRFHRGGLLRLGAVLASTSAPLRTSPVKRGDWILRRVLGKPVPPPPADAGSIPADDVRDDGLTLKARLIAHRREVSCVNCHARFDPLGFALEHFGVLGRWRETYRDGGAIDPTGTLDDGTKIDGPDGLDRYLKQRESDFHRTFAAKLLGYALGRSESLTDRPLIERMMTDLKDDGGISNVVVRIVTSRQFLHRRGREPVASGERPPGSGRKR